MKPNVKKFLDKANKIHNNKYTYKLEEYADVKTPFTMVCKIHGDFLLTPVAHFYETFPKGCPVCDSVTISKMRQDEFIEKAKKVHDKVTFDYSKVSYIRSTVKVIIGCSKHGDFLQEPRAHLSGHGCLACAREKTLFDHDTAGISGEQFYNNLPKSHSHITFDFEEYVNFQSKIKFKCEFHGHFITNPKYLMERRNGCMECTESLNGHSRSGFVALGDKNNKGKAFLYVIRCYSEKEEFFKVGITSRDFKERFYKSNLPYDYELIHLYEDDASTIWTLEKFILNLCKKSKYKPLLSFSGSSECLKF